MLVPWFVVFVIAARGGRWLHSHGVLSSATPWDIPHPYLFTSTIILSFTELLMLEEGVEINEG